MVATAAGVIWVYDLTRGTRAKVTLDSGPNVEPAWMPDGLGVVHVTRPSWGEGACHGSSFALQTAVAPSRRSQRATDPLFPSTGRHLVYTTYGGRPDIMRIDLRAPGAPVAVVNEEAASEREPAPRPTAGGLAFTSDTSGHDGACGRAFPAPSGSGRSRLEGRAALARRRTRASTRRRHAHGCDHYAWTTFSFGSPAKLFERPGSLRGMT